MSVSGDRICDLRSQRLRCYAAEYADLSTSSSPHRRSDSPLRAYTLIAVLILLPALLAAPLAADAAGKVPRIGFLRVTSPSDRLPDLAAELVRLKVDLIVSEGTQGVIADKTTTETIPIVMIAVRDPVGTGLI